VERSETRSEACWLFSTERGEERDGAYVDRLERQDTWNEKSLIGFRLDLKRVLDSLNDVLPNPSSDILTPLHHSLQHPDPRPLHRPSPIALALLDEASQLRLVEPGDGFGHNEVCDGVNGELAEPADKVGGPERGEEGWRGDEEEKLKEVGASRVAEEELEVVGAGGRGFGRSFF
jgi:hypothetical protein